ncbi:DNA repair protein RecN [Taibaiella lutea]|uniref:DNA repair protein RecN n=1 Tax=Taibaiella lutea TaxID=2608001 RepID=A0A5M6CMY8_9BACT|nr:DNA repair protein RecN [Taibaiella lutea]KAA5536413.1 DNA repair protein RecN [Taibaiella lutea]
MLQKLYIRNYVLIDKLEITFDPYLNVITGETGAGKSIILGALSLILGERADTSVLINREDKSVVEASFKTEKNIYFNSLLKREELDIEPVTIIRREISASGKSRAFVNDTPVTLTTLNELTSALVDMHRQFDNRALQENTFMYEVIDAVAENQSLLQEYKLQFSAYKQLQQQYKKLAESQSQWQKEADYKQFLFDELEQAAFKENEIEDAEIHLKQLSHAEQIKATLQLVYGSLEEGEQPLNNELKRMLQQLQTIVNVQPGTEALVQRMESALLELRDIAGELDDLQGKVDLDPEQLSFLQERIDAGYRLFKKHGVSATAELLAIYAQLSSELEAQNNSDTALKQLEEQIAQSEKELNHQAKELHNRRIKTAPEFSKKVNELLKLVGMPNAILQVEVSDSKALHEFGTDHIQFMFDANKSGKFSPVEKAASGGEMSRIMLCIKALTAKALALPTLIFDEVDSGISGEAAKQVGILLRSLSQYHQVLCITHQPQVAGKGTSHYFVYKTTGTDDKVKTNIRLLDNDERVRAIAQMIGGEKPSEAAMENAKELVG